MALSIPRSLVECILLGPDGDRRQLQDSPILGDVWMAFANQPHKAHELLITPHRAQSAGFVATVLNERIQQLRTRKEDLSEIAYLQGVIAARLYFREVLGIIVPMTEWWSSPRNNPEIKIYLNVDLGLARIRKVFETVHKLVLHWSAPSNHPRVGTTVSAFDRYAAVAGLILWASKAAAGKRKGDGVSSEELARRILEDNELIQNGLQEMFVEMLNGVQQNKKTENTIARSLIFQISLNREATVSVSRSIPAVKADAARKLFSINCSKVAWAVIDAGIQGNHEAFLDARGKSSRVLSSFDFTKIRQIVSLDNNRILEAKGQNANAGEARLATLLHDKLESKPSKDSAIANLRALAADARNGRPIDWELVKPFVQIKVDTPPESDHGTHVGGIIGASRNTTGQSQGEEEGEEDNVDGMCPDIQLYDFRVLAPTLKETEFAIIAALQFIRHLNQKNEHLTIHGANLSLSIPHDVRNYACGRTPVCTECERLVDSGVVVVAAAGNLGYQSFETKEGTYDGYAAYSVTDPGNADGVITVGATHRYSPHTYGVSFFSSRGPTGDGRMKPDLVAPGERIRAPFCSGWGDLDGTSMAAPHVSGAAAMLMARYSELIGQPRRIKHVLCNSATDLGRERSFQGHGMLDVLRAFQSF